MVVTYRVPNRHYDRYKVDYNFYMRCYRILYRNGKFKLAKRMLKLANITLKRQRDYIDEYDPFYGI